MSEHDCAFDRQVLVVAVCGQRLEYPLQSTSLTPEAVTLMHRFSIALTIRQIATVCARAQSHQTAIDKQAVVRAATSMIAALLGKNDAISPTGPRSAHIA